LYYFPPHGWFLLNCEIKTMIILLSFYPDGETTESKKKTPIVDVSFLPNFSRIKNC